MSSTRDPHKDPRPGDVLRVPLGDEYAVVEVTAAYVRDKENGDCLCENTIGHWRYLMAESEVVHAAE